MMTQPMTTEEAKNTGARPRGATWNPNIRKWMVQLSIGGVRKYLGCFADPAEAALAYERARAEHPAYPPGRRPEAPPARRMDADDESFLRGLIERHPGEAPARLADRFAAARGWRPAPAAVASARAKGGPPRVRTAHPPGKSGHRGVYWHAKVGKWQAKIGIGGKYRHLGYFDDPAEASLAYRRARAEIPDGRGRWARRAPAPAPPTPRLLIPPAGLAAARAEIDALRAILDAIEPLEPDAARRALAWAAGVVGGLRAGGPDSDANVVVTY
jgi:hypothetical protein